MKFSDLADIMRSEVGEEAAARLCLLICNRAHGAYIYVPRRPGPPEIRPNDTPATIVKRYGVSRQTGYNWVNRWR